jgi:hypothetical protein
MIHGVRMKPDGLTSPLTYFFSSLTGTAGWATLRLATMYLSSSFRQVLSRE